MSSAHESITIGFHSIVRSGVEFRGACYRNVKPEYADRERVLSPEGSYLHGGRYNAAGEIRALYLALDLATLVAEIAGAFSDAKLSNQFPRMLVSIEVALANVLDLTDAWIRETIGVTLSDLVEVNWRSERPSEKTTTQVIGQLAHHSGFQAILAPSARLHTGRIVCIFTDNTPRSAYRLINAHLLPPG